MFATTVIVLIGLIAAALLAVLLSGYTQRKDRGHE
jgi:hypothetical protein|tara:strand:+ start:2935 stop:3039 length:105 start_codon:yes stop_codon:yes gene_type:complete